jgi:protein disulfide-isomerase
MPSAMPATNSATTQPTLCLDGHCPVTLMETQRWLYGDRRFGAVHRGRLYLFTSTDAQQRFLADPDRYSPAISGHDAVAWVDQGRLVAGERKFGGYYRNFIYLFASEEALRQFEANPERYAAPVEQAVAVGKGQGQVRR